MGKKLLLAALLLLGVAVGVLFLLWPEQPAPRAIRSGFLDFTNMPTGLAARFAVTNYPEGAIFPAVFSMATFENGEWKSMPKPSGGWQWVQFCIGCQSEAVYTLAVPTTNVPVRVVMEIRTKPTGWRALAQRMAVRVGRNPSQWHVRLPALYFTNETVTSLKPQ